MKNAVFGVEANRTCEHTALDISTDTDKLLRTMVVPDPDDVLFDDWPLIEIGSDIVCGCANEFDAAVIGLVVRL